MSAIDREVGVGQCPERSQGLGHVWAGALASGDRNNPCRFCGFAGRQFFAEATAARAERFSRLKAPMQSGTGDPKKAAR